MDAEDQKIWPAAPMEMPALPAPSRIKIVLTDIAGSPILRGNEKCKMQKSKCKMIEGLAYNAR
jgi:hypothetical protein